MKHLLLLVEGKRSDRPSYLAGLSKKGFQVESAINGSTALKMLNHLDPKAVVIDAASMRTTGTRICTSIRKKVGKTPIILVVSEDEENAKSNSADVVLRLPFTLQKLLNRLKPYMSMNNNKMMEVGPIKLDLEQRWVYCEGKRERLTPRLFKLMKRLMKHPGELHTREDLFRELWETDYLGDTRSLDVHISWLRQAIEEDTRNPQYIKTERGIGYRLEIEKPKRPRKPEKK